MVVVGIGWLDDLGGARPTFAGDLNLDVGVRAEVMEPRRRTIGAAVGGHDKVILAVACVDEAVRPGRARATASGSEQQGRDTDHTMSNPPVASLIELVVDSEDLACDAHTTQTIGRPVHRATQRAR